jgi:uncharacterized protein involved in type VI secretion and phage assembly
LQIAVVTAVHVDKSGPFADIQILTDAGRTPDTARIAGAYAGPSYGFYCPVDVDDEVIIGVPDGDPNHGYVIVSRCWSASDPPPQEAIDHPQDVVLHVRKDKTMRIVVEGGGNIALDVADGKVQLGGESDLTYAVLGDKLDAFIDEQRAFNANHTHPFVYSAGPSAGAKGDTLITSAKGPEKPNIRATKVDLK